MRPIWKLFTLILFTLTVTIYFARILILNEFTLRKFCLFLQDWRFCRSRSSKADIFGANRKRVCDFLLARNSNLGPILHHFGDMTAFMCSWPHLFSTLILGVFPLHQIAHVGVSQRISLNLFGREVIFEEFQINLCEHGTGRPTWSASQTDRQTDAILSQYRAVHSIAREKENIISWIRIHDM